MLQTENVQANAEDFKDRWAYTLLASYLLTSSLLSSSLLTSFPKCQNLGNREEHGEEHFDFWDSLSLHPVGMRMSSPSGKRWRRRSALCTRWLTTPTWPSQTWRARWTAWGLSFGTWPATTRRWVQHEGIKHISQIIHSEYQAIGYSFSLLTQHRNKYGTYETLTTKMFIGFLSCGVSSVMTNVPLTIICLQRVRDYNSLLSKIKIISWLYESGVLVLCFAAPYRTWGCSTSIWQVARWTSRTLPLRPIWTRYWPTFAPTGKESSRRTVPRPMLTWNTR